MRKKLLRGSDWISKRLQIGRTLSLPVVADKALEKLERQLDTVYRRTVENFPNHQAVRIEQVDGKPDLIPTGLEKIDEPPSLV